MIPGQVLSEADGNGRIVLEESHGPVAAQAQQPADALPARVCSRAARVIVIDGKAMRGTRVKLPADRAAAALRFQHRIVGGEGHAVMRHQPPAELAQLRAFRGITGGVIAANALAGLVGGTAPARAPDPFVLGPGAVPRPYRRARAQQRVTHGTALRSHQGCDLVHGLATFIQACDLGILRFIELSSASHGDIVNRGASDNKLRPASCEKIIKDGG